MIVLICHPQQIIYLIRHSTSSIRNLDPANRSAAVQAYGHALHVVFIFNLVLSVLNVLALMLVKEEEMPDQRKSQAGQSSPE